MNSFLHFAGHHEVVLVIAVVALFTIIVGAGLFVVWRALGEAKDGEETPDGLRLKS